MRILIDGCIGETGGGAKFLENFCKFSSAESELVVFSQYEFKCGNPNVRIIKVRLGIFGSILLWRMIVFPIICLIYKPDRIYCFAGVFSWFLDGKKVLCFLHNIIPFDEYSWSKWGHRDRFKFRCLRRMLISSYSRAFGVVFFSDASYRLVESYLSYPIKRALRARYGVGLQFLQARDIPAGIGGGIANKNSVNVVVVASLSPHKDLDTVITGLCFTRLSIPISVEIFGTDFHKLGLKQFNDALRRLDASENVTIKYRGWVDNEHLADAYRCADVVVIPSLSENSPISAVEAFVASKGALVVSDAPSLVELGVSQYIYARGEALSFKNIFEQAIGCGVRLDSDGADLGDSISVDRLDFCSCISDLDREISRAFEGD